MTTQVDYEDRDDLDVQILDALIDRGEEGMTVFELRTHVDVNIDELEAALQALKDDGLILVDTDARGPDDTVIKPAPAVIPQPDNKDPETVLDRIRRWLGR